jgi:hypothetical protein
MSDKLNVEDVDRTMAAAASGAGGSNDHQVQHHASRCECFPLRTLSALRIPFSRCTPREAIIVANDFFTNPYNYCYGAGRI